MHRVGLWPPEDVVEFAHRAEEAGLEVEGIWTHFARADDEATTLEQLRRFLMLLKACLGAGIRPKFAHAANSAATMKHPESHLDLVRPGVSIYGLSPGGVDMAGLGLKPALTWRSEVAMSKRLPAGEAISYGHTYRLARDSTVATVPVGYADGYSRGLSSRAQVLICGRRFPVAGTVTMDQLLVDCGDEDVRAGEEVVLLGRQADTEVSADELADLAGTINYEIVCAIGERVPREYVGRGG
jgi:alanine racemase